MKNQNKHLPITKNEYNNLIGKDPLVDTMLKTGLRISEAVQLFKILSGDNTYQSNRVMIKRKGGAITPIYLSKDVLELAKKSWVEFGSKDWTRFTLHTHVKGVMERAGVQGTPHSLRATFATRLIERGVDLVTIQTLMNHKDISTTSKYIKINEEGLTNAVNVLNNDSKTFEGMTIQQCKKEIMRLRRALNG